MKLNGRNITIKAGTSTPLKLFSEKSATLTISQGTVQAAGQNRGDKNHNTRRGWKLTGQFLLRLDHFISLYSAIASTTPMTFEFVTAFNNSETRVTTFSGKGFVTRLAFAGQGRGLVTLNISVTGTGKPTMQTITKDTLLYNDGNKYNDGLIYQ